MLREALAQRSRNVKKAREIWEGKDLKEILHESIETDKMLQLDSRWWLENFFDKHNLSFAQGVILIYVLAEIPRLTFLLLMLGQANESFVMSFISTFFGDMFIPFSLLLVHNIYKSLVTLKRHTNEISRRKGFVAPCIRISEEELASSDSLIALDTEYQNRYIKPVMLRTFQQGLDLSFNRSYMIGSGIIAASLFYLLMFLRFVLRVLPETFFAIAEPGIPEIAVPYLIWFFAMIGFDWFIIGMVTWTVFVTFLVSIQASGNAIGIRPFESIKEYLAPITTLVLKTSFTVTFLTAWVSPLLLVWSVLPVDPMVREAIRMLVGSTVAIMTPVIVLSFLIPILKIHKGMAESRRRVLVLKKYQLDKLKRKPGSDVDRYLKIQAHLIQDYKDIQNKPVWLLNLPQMLELMGTVLLPIITFLISIRV